MAATTGTPIATQAAASDGRNVKTSATEALPAPKSPAAPVGDGAAASWLAAVRQAVRTSTWGKPATGLKQADERLGFDPLWLLVAFLHRSQLQEARAVGQLVAVSDDVNDIRFEIGAGRLHVISVRVDDQMGVEGELPPSQRVEEGQILGGQAGAQAPRERRR